MIKLSNLRISSKLRLSLYVSVMFIVGIGVLTYFDVYAKILEGRQLKTRHIVEVASAVIEYNFTTSVDGGGSLSKEAAQKNALRELQSLRYGDGEYFWVNDISPTILMHPIKPALNGKDASGIKDPNGKTIFVEFAKIASSRKEGGFVNYMWPAPDAKEGDAPIDKISYVKQVPAWGWVVGSGIYIRDVKAETLSVIQQLMPQYLAIIVFISAINFLISRDIRRPLVDLKNGMQELQNKNFDIVIGGLSRKDEVGEMSVALESFRLNLKEAEKQREIQHRQDLLKQERARRIEHLVAEFDKEIVKIADTLGAEAQSLMASSELMASASRNTSERSTIVASAAEEAAGSSSTVASATEELTASINEISRQMDEATVLVSSASSQSVAANDQVSQLADASRKIGDVISLIHDIADKTNLLALNATIEAARAGDAGKGFAVVASEVKSLAAQTAEATGDITLQVESIQQSVKGAVEAISHIHVAINDINAVSTTIASAIEEQGAATQEISRNVAQTSEGTKLVSSNILSVSDSARNTEETAMRVANSADVLTGEINHLQSTIRTFINDVKKQDGI